MGLGSGLVADGGGDLGSIKVLLDGLLSVEAEAAAAAASAGADNSTEGIDFVLPQLVTKACAGVCCAGVWMVPEWFRSCIGYRSIT